MAYSEGMSAPQAPTENTAENKLLDDLYAEFTNGARSQPNGRESYANGRGSYGGGDRGVNGYGGGHVGGAGGGYVGNAPHGGYGDSSGGGYGRGAAALPYSGGSSVGMSLREACEAACSGASTGSCVQDNDIKVVDCYERPMPNTKCTTFESMTEFPNKIVDELKRAFPGPSQIQAYTWPIAMQGKDIVGIAATGSGKTLAFLLPAFSEFYNRRWDPYRDGAGLLVMSPTRELAQQIENEAIKFGSCLGMTSVAMYGGSPKRDQLMQYRKGVHCIVACPGRLNDFIENRQVDVSRVRKLVLDEADRMLDMGFEPQIRKILEHVPRQRHTLFFTATWPREVQKLAYNILHQPCKVMIGNRDELKANQDVTQQVRIVDKWSKSTAIISILREAGLMDRGSRGKALVFASTKRMCEQLSNELYRAGVYCAAIHGDKDQGARDKALNGLKSGDLQVLVATDVAARGLDIKGVGLVVNYDMANNTEDYVHRIGRTGRAGCKGYAITLFTREDEGKAKGLVQVLQSSNQEVPEELRDMSRRGGGGDRRRWGGGGGGGGGGWGGGKGGGRGRSRSPRRW